MFRGKNCFESALNFFLVAKAARDDHFERLSASGTATIPQAVISVRTTCILEFLHILH